MKVGMQTDLLFCIKRGRKLKMLDGYDNRREIKGFKRVNIIHHWKEEKIIFMLISISAM
jgi:hypothetical protein